MKTKLAIAGAALLLTGAPATAQSSAMLLPLLNSVLSHAEGSKRDRLAAFERFVGVIPDVIRELENSRREQEREQRHAKQLQESELRLLMSQFNTLVQYGGRYHRQNVVWCDTMEYKGFDKARPGTFASVCEFTPPPQPAQQQCPAADCSQVADEAAERLVATKQQLDRAQERVAGLGERIAVLEELEEQVIPWLCDIPITGKNHDKLDNYGSKQAYDALAEHAPEIGTWQQENCSEQR